jgi:hypothetical protein
MTIEQKEIVIDIGQKKEKFLALVKPADGCVWHYTSVDILDFFLRGEIAFTHYKFMNDDDEIECGIRMLKKMAAEGNSDFLKYACLENPFFLFD